MHVAGAVVTLAQILIAAQARCSQQRALELMVNTARATDEHLDYIAEEVVAGRVTF
jgi:hypothetical protein